MWGPVDHTFLDVLFDLALNSREGVWKGVHNLIILIHAILLVVILWSANALLRSLHAYPTACGSIHTLGRAAPTGNT